MMLSLALLLALQAPAPPVAMSSDSGDPPGRAARLSVREGRVSFQPSGDTAASSWSEAVLNYTLTSGDRLYADQNSRAELEAGNCTVRLGAGTDLTIASLTDAFFQLSISGGSLRVSVYDLHGDSVEVDTPNGAFLLRQAGAYRVDVSDADSTTTIRVDSGLAEVATGEVVQSVRAGDALQLSGSDPIRMVSLAPRPPDDFDRWSASRDQPLVASVSARYVGRNVPGYDELDRAGSWETVPEYGPVWYPNEVPSEWAPYRAGHWAWIDPWGWTWVDDAPWGYVPFHYGRWVYWRDRWVWAPGRFAERPCYAPALVVFVSVGNGGVQGWFPLGPREPYRPWYHHGREYRDRVNVDVTVVSTREVHYVNRPRITAVPVTVFQGGEPVDRRVVRVTQPEITRAQIIAHPRVQPLPQAAGWSRPASPGQPAVQPPVVASRPRPEIHVTPWKNPPVPAQIRNGPVLQRPPGVPAPQPGLPSRQVPPPVIARNPPVPAAVPFPTRQKAMQQTDPGRPLEPVQRQNLREGKPAGPHRDAEEPDHPTKPAPRQKKPAPQRPARDKP
jgi:hypothetical protein